MTFNLNKALIVLGIVALTLVGIFAIWWNHAFIITGGGFLQQHYTPASLSGLGCANSGQRPLAVMLASDPPARPLSGISSADIVVEMPVAPNGITRFMALFQCDIPKEIGSVRSAREDFIPLAAAFDAIYAHWGGEYDALKQLDSGIINNIDAMKYEGTYFYRKPGIQAPHNGFTNADLLKQGAQKLGYDLSDSFKGYPRTDESADRNLANISDTIDIAYPSPYDIEWVYSQNDRAYVRSRGGSQETDKNTNSSVKASVVIIMKTRSKFLRDQYITVATTGQGDAEIYQDGVMTRGIWKKDSSSLDSKLYFLDNNGNEVKFIPGKIWIEIVAL